MHHQLLLLINVSSSSGRLVASAELVCCAAHLHCTKASSVSKILTADLHMLANTLSLTQISDADHVGYSVVVLGQDAKRQLCLK